MLLVFNKVLMKRAAAFFERVCIELGLNLEKKSHLPLLGILVYNFSSTCFFYILWVC